LDGSQENLFLGQLPKRVVIGCVDNDAYNGSFNKNPFNFKNYDINYVALYMNGQQVPGKPLQPNFQRKKFVKSYMTLFTSLNKAGQDEGNNISHKEYPQGYTLFAFDLTPDLEDGSHLNLTKYGTLRLELHFARPLPRTINVIVLAEFQNTVESNQSRNILFDYAA
jgi:hypothetical protein